MQKEIKKACTPFMVCEVVFRYHWDDFISFNLPRALQENDTVGIVFSIVFGIIFLAMILGFGHLISCTKRLQEKYRRISSTTIRTGEENVELFKERMRPLSKLNQLRFTAAIFQPHNMDDSLIYLSQYEIQALGKASSGSVTERYVRRISSYFERRKEFRSLI